MLIRLVAEIHVVDTAFLASAARFNAKGPRVSPLPVAVAVKVFAKSRVKACENGAPFSVFGAAAAVA